MIRSLKIILIALFILSGVSCFAQVAKAQDEPMSGELKKEEPLNDMKSTVVNKEDNKQDTKSATKKGSVKQVKSARPDMTKSRGARPPDIVRPSGSRIPRGVGRPTGAGRRSRG